jgi:RNA-directed DNA polymerase
MGQEKWDRRIVPKSRRKTVSTAATQGGKATAVSQRAVQLELFGETADNSERDHAEADTGQPVPATCVAPKSPNTTSDELPAMVMSEVAMLSNLESAFQKVAANRGAPGPDRKSIDEVRKQLRLILARVHRELLDGSYQPGLIRRVWIPKSGGGGQRGLGIPDVVDRIVAQSVLQIMGPHYDPTFHPSSHGFRPGRSCHTAIAEARTYLEEGFEWVVDLDLNQFFDRVPHERLMARLRQRVHDPLLLQLIRRMLKAKVVLPNGVVVNTDEGTPQGGPLSPLLSNIVLDELDWELSRRGHRFVRYADDANIYVRSERAGQRVMSSITRFIEHRLRLRVNVEKSAVANPETRHFLGFRLQALPEDGGSRVFLSERSRLRIRERIRDLTPRNWGRSLDDCLSSLNAYLRGWLNFFCICTNEGRTFDYLDRHIRRRIRALLLKQWKRKRSIVKRLLKLGVSRRSAASIHGGKRSLWALSKSNPVHAGLSNMWFAERGLFSLNAAWRKYRQSHRPEVQASG